MEFCISYRFRDIDAFSSNIACFPAPLLFEAKPPSRGTPCDINVIYTPLKSTFNGLLFYLHSFSLCCLPKSWNHTKFWQNLTLQ